MALKTGLTIEEFLAAEWPPDTQLIDGEAVMNDPSFRHQEITARLVEALRAWTRVGHQRGTAGFGGNWTVAPGQVFKPDAWLAVESTQPGPDAVRSDTPPTLAVEVRSPGTWHLDTGRKRQVYEEVGVAELWLVDTPARSVLFFRRSHADSPEFDVSTEVASPDILTSPLLEGFSLAVDDLFAD